MLKYSWSQYNKENSNLSSKIIKFNNLRKINFIEKGLYNHIRDIFCIVILFNRNKNRRIKILDYGSNLLALSNISSKIDVKSFDFSIYDPFYSKEYSDINKIFKIKFFTKNNKLKFEKFDVVNFGSSLQYMANIELLNQTLNFKPVKTILITHTPITLSKSYRSRQKNHKNLIQNVHTLNSIEKYFNKIGFKLLFKSRNDEKYIACEKKQKKTHSLNLIFIKS
jgi:hypothetical protein